MVERVKSIAPRFQDGLKAFAHSPIIGEVNPVSSFSEFGLKSGDYKLLLRHSFCVTKAFLLLQIRGTGLILATEFADNKSPNDPFPPEWGEFLNLFPL